MFLARQGCGMAGKLSAMGTWLKAAGSRFAFFAASLVCGIVVPLSTLGAEAHVRGKIDAVSWFSAGVTYVAGIGLVSRTKLGNCSGRRLRFQAAQGRGRRSRVRRMASMARIDLRRAVSTTDRISA